jgi:hypothetical protein
MKVELPYEADVKGIVGEKAQFIDRNLNVNEITFDEDRKRVEYVRQHSGERFQREDLMRFGSKPKR